MTLFGILNLVVSGEAVEGLYKFFKNKGKDFLKAFKFKVLTFSNLMISQATLLTAWPSVQF